jgi:hypothetical protein
MCHRRSALMGGGAVVGVGIGVLGGGGGRWVVMEEGGVK